MKSIFLLGILFSTAAISQPAEQGVQITHYVLDSFLTGTIIMKSGEKQQSLLNYNTLTHEMIFERNGERLAIAQPEDVDTVYIYDRKFVYVNKVFYEVLATTPVALYLEYQGSILKTGANIGYGISSSNAGNTAISTITNGGKVYDLKLPYDYTVKVKKVYWLRKGFNYYKAGNVKQVMLVFPDKEKLIRDYTKKNNTDFTKPEDITALIKEIQS